MEELQNRMDKKNCFLGALAGIIIGLLLLPVLRAAKPEFFTFKFNLSLVIFFVIATPLGLFFAHLLGRKMRVIWQLAKFGVTGVMNFLVDLGILSILIFISQDYFQVEAKKTILSLGFVILTFYSIYKAISFVLASFNSYFWNKFWTFEKKSTEKTGKEFSQFFVVSLIGFVLNVLVASYVFKSIDLPGLTPSQWGLVGAAAGSIVGLSWNFLGYKFIVFKK